MFKFIKTIKNMIHNLTARCMKCREQKEIKDLQIITTKNNRNAATGICPICGTKLFRFLPKDFRNPSKPKVPDSSSVSTTSLPTSTTSLSQGTENAKEIKPENAEKEIEGFDEVSM